MINFDDYFANLQTQGISLTDSQKRWYIKKYEVLGEDIKKEFPSTPDEAFEINTIGYYYATQISFARSQKRICNLPNDETLKVHTAWDLGFHDSMCIIFFKINGKEIHIVDYIEGTGKSLTEYIKEIKKKDYIFGTHIAPHDIKVHELTTGMTRLESAAKLGINFVLAPDLSLADGIDKTRNMFNRLYFHTSEPVLKLVHHIENYSQKWDKTMGAWSGRADHDEHSHAADALRYLCLGLDYCLDDSQSITQEQADSLWRQHGRRI